LQVKRFYTICEWCKVLTGYLSLGHRPGGDWANTWHVQNVLQSSFQTGSSSSPSCFHILSLSHSWSEPFFRSTI